MGAGNDGKEEDEERLTSKRLTQKVGQRGLGGEDAQRGLEEKAAVSGRVQGTHEDGEGAVGVVGSGTGRCGGYAVG